MLQWILVDVDMLSRTEKDKKSAKITIDLLPTTVNGTRHTCNQLVPLRLRMHIEIKNEYPI